MMGSGASWNGSQWVFGAGSVDLSFTNNYYRGSNPSNFCSLASAAQLTNGLVGAWITNGLGGGASSGTDSNAWHRGDTVTGAVDQVARDGLTGKQPTGSYVTVESDPNWGANSAAVFQAVSKANVSVSNTDSRLTDARVPVAHTQVWTTISGTPTTVSGYGITDGVTNADPRLTDTRTDGAAVHTNDYAPNIIASIVQSQAIFTVSGTATPDISGTYVQNGTYNGYPAFSNVNRMGVCLCKNTPPAHWYIAATNIYSVPPPDLLHTPLWQSEASPPDNPANVVNWYPQGYSGASGTPTLADATINNTNTIAKVSQIAFAALPSNGSASALTGITAAQVGAVSTSGVTSIIYSNPASFLPSTTTFPVASRYLAGTNAAFAVVQVLASAPGITATITATNTTFNGSGLNCGLVQFHIPSNTVLLAAQTYWDSTSSGAGTAYNALVFDVGTSDMANASMAARWVPRISSVFDTDGNRQSSASTALVLDTSNFSRFRITSLSTTAASLVNVGW